jgi:predicted aconitase with swiveling domain
MPAVRGGGAGGAMNGPLVLRGECLLPGETSAPVVRLSAPLSLWGGFSLEDGTVCDVNHPDYGLRLAGRVLVMPGGRGSSSSSSVLLESARLGIHPRALVLAERDPILVVGALVAAELYRVSIPVIRLSPGDLARASTGDLARVFSRPGSAFIELAGKNSEFGIK